MAIKSRDLLAASVQAAIDHFRWSQADLARRMKWSRTAVSYILKKGGVKGTTLKNIDELSRVFRLRPMDLFDPETIAEKLVTNPDILSSDTESAGVYDTARLEARLLQLDVQIGQLEHTRGEVYEELVRTLDAVRKRAAGHPNRTLKVVPPRGRKRD